MVLSPVLGDSLGVSTGGESEGVGDPSAGVVGLADPGGAGVGTSAGVLLAVFEGLPEVPDLAGLCDRQVSRTSTLSVDMVDILCFDRFPVSSRDTRFRNLDSGRFWEASTLRCPLAVREGSARRRQSSQRRVARVGTHAHFRVERTRTGTESDGPVDSFCASEERLQSKRQFSEAESRCETVRTRALQSAGQLWLVTRAGREKTHSPYAYT